MTEKSIRHAFTAKAGELDAEIFLLSNSARQEFHAIQAAGDRQQREMREEQGKRRPGEIETVLRQINTEHAALKPRPSWQVRSQRKTPAERQAAAEHKVDRRHAAEIATLNQQHRQEQDEFLARKKQERLSREVETARAKSSKATPSLKRDFDRSR